MQERSWRCGSTGLRELTGCRCISTVACRQQRDVTEAGTLTWTRITDPDEAAGLLPAWFGSRMIGLRGKFGLLLTTGEILRITSVTALHESPHGVILLDVLLDHAGVPDGVDEAWRTKRYLGAPVPGATMATVNLAHVVSAVEFIVAEIVEPPGEKALLRRDELEAGQARPDPLVKDPLERRTPDVVPATK
jgi:hypothetical protein